MISLTWNAPIEAFKDPEQFFEGKTVDDVFMWLHKNFQFFGMEPLPTFSCHDVLKDAAVEHDIKRLGQHLNSIFDKAQL